MASRGSGRNPKLLAYTDSTAIGGAEQALAHLLTELDRSIRVAVLGVDPEVVDWLAARRPETESGVVPAPGTKANVAAIVSHIRAVRAAAPDLVQINLHSPWQGQYGILAGLLNAVPVVAVEHTVFESRSTIQRVLRRRLSSRLAAHVAVGERVARRIEDVIRLPAGSVEVIRNGIPDMALNPVPRPAGVLVVGAVARLTRPKGIDVLIEALGSLQPEVGCVVVGDGPERPALEQLAARCGVRDRLTITGWVDRPRDYLAGFDVVAVPSRFEGLPLTILEAMLAERPVVAFDVGSVDEAVVNGVTGVLVPPGDPDALGTAIRTLLDDPELRAQMGTRARERALGHFSSRAMARSYERLYRRLLG